MNQPLTPATLTPGAPPQTMASQAQPLTLQSVGSHALRGRIQAIQQVMADVMKADTHFGVIPGTDKPSLWKPGAEVICAMFQLAPILETQVAADFTEHVVRWKSRKKVWFDGPAGRDFKWEVEEGETTGYYEVVAQCAIVSLDGHTLSRVSGSANNLESKYRTQSMWDTRNTIRKMAEKRAFVAAVLLATGASDIFTQDLEDATDEEIERRVTNGKPATSAPSTGKDGAGNGLNAKQNGLAAVKARDVLGLQGPDHESFMSWFSCQPSSGSKSAKAALDALCKGGEQAEVVRKVWLRSIEANKPSTPAAEPPAEPQGGAQ